MPIDRAAICRNFTQLRDTFDSHADSVDTLIAEIIAKLKTVLRGPYLTKFVDAWDKAATTEERIAAAEAACTRLTRLLQSGAPIEPWVGEAQELLAHLIKLLQALKALRELEKAMAGHVTDWCG
ncbi:MAG: hypothetical protein K0S54_2293 [Alphaproteobacteria bacterium]|jgi:hypothetical protein|nr:hypothetical protein [Alphaproteobacteria bacterium]